MNRRGFLGLAASVLAAPVVRSRALIPEIVDGDGITSRDEAICSRGGAPRSLRAVDAAADLERVRLQVLNEINERAIAQFVDAVALVRS